MTSPTDPLRGAVRDARGAVAGMVRQIVAGTTESSPPPEWNPEDPGLFPPDSAVRIVHADAAGFIGGVRSILLQSLHPAAMRAVSQHSNFREDPLGRLQRTASFLGSTTFGSGTDAREAIEIVKRVHDRVVGTMPDGTEYRASDPHLLRWVHITEVASFLTAFRRYGSTPITDAQADEYVAHMARVGMGLGMTDAPTTVAELHADIERYRPELASTPESEEATLFMLSPPLPLKTKPAYGIIFSAALASLPHWARNLLMLPLPPGVSRLAIQPAAQVVTRSLHWALSAPDPSLTASE